LDDVPGLGETRRKALMKQFGSLKRLRAATVEELVAVPGIGRRTAEAVLAAVAEPGAEPAAGSAGETAEVVESTTAPAGPAEVVESTTAPAGPAERGTPQAGAGATAEVGRVAS
jgi:excinuclease ABC subunit C